jgi:sortase A
MKPNDVSSTPANVSPVTVGHVEPKPTQPAQQQAAADIVRAQIEGLYSGGAQTVTAAALNGNQTLEDVNPYDRTHTANPQPTADQWKQYHSAWQTYYQKYYEGYYTHHLKQATAKQAANPSQQYFGNQPHEEPAAETLSKDEALFDLRQKLLAKVQSSAKKVRKSRHFVPITSAIIVMVIFGFLQYNRVIIANVMAYVSPGSIDPQNIVIDPSTDITVGPEPRLIIPKINVDVPVSYDVGNDYASQMKAMAVGVAQFAIPGADSHPGQIGNTVIAGHSSNDLLDSGDYKFIFAQLDKLAVGDSIYANYQGKRYTYTVTGKAVVEPNDVNKLVYPTTKPVMTLLTCTPLGTALHRLLVTAEQVSPDPTKSTAAPTTTSTQNASMPGNSPTLFERLFGQK